MQKTSRLCSLLVCGLLFGQITACGILPAANNHTYEDFDVRAHLGLTFPADNFDFGNFGGETADTSAAGPNVAETAPQSFRMTVVGTMNVYETESSEHPCNTLADGTQITLTEPEEGSEWATVHDLAGNRLGVTKEGFLHAIDAGATLYAELPVE